MGDTGEPTSMDVVELVKSVRSRYGTHDVSVFAQCLALASMKYKIGLEDLCGLLSTEFENVESAFLSATKN